MFLLLKKIKIGLLILFFYLIFFFQLWFIEVNSFISVIFNWDPLSICHFTFVL